MSINHVLIHITNTIQKASDNGTFVFGVYVDFNKAFHTGNHNILLHKSNRYGVRGTESSWFKSYLRTRQQYTTVSSYSLKNAYIEYGFHKALS